MIEIVETEVEDCYRLAPRLRKMDHEECIAGGWPSGTEPLLDGLERSVECETFLVDGKPIGIRGYRRTYKGCVVWCLGSDEVVTYRKTLHAMAIEWVGKLLDRYGYLYNTVYAENTLHIKWLKRLGFTIGKEITNKNNYKFRYFYKGENNYV